MPMQNCLKKGNIVPKKNTISLEKGIVLMFHFILKPNVY